MISFFMKYAVNFIISHGLYMRPDNCHKYTIGDFLSGVTLCRDELGICDCDSENLDISLI